MRSTATSRTMPRTTKRKRSESDLITFTLNPSPMHQDAWKAAIQQLYRDGKATDITFSVQGHLFQAHRTVLIAGNHFLGAMLTAGMCESQQDVINLDLDHVLFRHMLDWSYSLPLQVTSEYVQPLLSAANAYSMLSLCDVLVELLIQQLTPVNTSALFVMGDALSQPILRSRALLGMLSNLEQVSQHQGFLEMPSVLVQEVLSSDALEGDETAVFQAAVRWQEVNGRDIEVLKCVRYPLMDCEYLSEMIKPHELFQGGAAQYLLMEAFEYHAHIAHQQISGKPTLRTLRSLRTSPRQKCVFSSTSPPLSGHSDAVSALLVVDDCLVSGSWDNTLRIWASNPTNSTHSSFSTIQTITTTGSIRSLVQFTDHVLSCSDDGAIQVYGPTWELEKTLEAHDGAVNALLVVQGRLASAGDDGNVKLWSLSGTSSWACEVTLHHTQEVGKVGILSMEQLGKYLFTGADDSCVRVWDTSTWTCIQVLRAHHDEVWTLCAVGPFLASGSVDGSIRIWRQDGDWVCDHHLTTSGPVYALAAMDGKLISAGAAAHISIWKPSGNTWVLQASMETDSDVWALAQSKGQLISGFMDGVIRVWTK